MSKQEFLDQPNKACTSIFSIGERGTGKTFVALQSIKYWMQNNIFDHYYLVLPDFEDEQNDSYAWLAEYKNVTVYEGYHSKYGREILERSKKNKEEHKLHNKPLEKYMLFIDDAANEGKKLMRCQNLLEISISARHKRIQSWFCLHAVANIIPPCIRNAVGCIFLYPVGRAVLKLMYKDFINFPKDFKNYDEFELFFDEYVTDVEFNAFLLFKPKRPNKYSVWVNQWFPQE